MTDVTPCSVNDDAVLSSENFPLGQSTFQCGKEQRRDAGSPRLLFASPVPHDYLPPGRSCDSCGSGLLCHLSCSIQYID